MLPMLPVSQKNGGKNAIEINTRCERKADGALLVTDSRPSATIKQIELSGVEAAVYDYCDEVHSTASLVQDVSENFPDEDFSNVNETIQSRLRAAFENLR